MQSVPTTRHPFNRRIFGECRCVALALIVLLLASSHAQSENRRPHLHGGSPPSLVRRPAYAEALKFSRQVAQDPSIHLHDTPRLLSAQRAVDFQHSARPAWLLLHSVGKAGPRAHTNVSQLALVSAKDGKVLWKAPQGLDDLGESCPADMDDAVMVEIMPGRFVLGLSCGAGFRWDGSASVLALGGARPLESLFHWPAEGDPRNTESTIYFARLSPREPLALAVHQEHASISAKGESTLIRRQLLFRFDPKLQRYIEAEHPPAKLQQLIETARRQKSPSIFQHGSMAFENVKVAIEEKAAADRDLNRVHQQLRQKLSAQGREALKQEELQWRVRRDELDWEKRAAFIRKRTEELRERLGKKRSAILER